MDFLVLYISYPPVADKILFRYINELYNMDLF